MAETSYGINITSVDDYKIPRYWSKKLKEDKILITTDHGAWVILSQKEYDMFRFKKVHEDPALFNYLEEKCIIYTKNNENKIIEEYKTRYSPLFNGTSLHIIVPTLRCNYRCIYCHAFSRPMDAEGYDMDKETAENVVKFIFQTPAPAITIEFQGGEPLVNFPIVKYIVTKVKELNKVYNKKISFSIVSNFSLMDKEKMKFLIKNEFNINTSLDGPRELQNKNRIYPNGDSYDEVVKWIKKFREIKYHNIGALPTITRYSFPYYKEIVDEYLKLGFTHLRARPMNDAGLASKTWKKIGYTAEEFLDFWMKYINYLIEINKKGKFIFDETIQFILDKILLKNYIRYTCWGAPCGAALQQTAYDQDGNIYTCDEARSFEIFRLGNVKEHTYKDIYCSPQALSMINISSQTSTMCDACIFHPYCGPCPVSSYGSYGTPIPKLHSERLCKIRKGIMTFVFEKLCSEDKKILFKWIKNGKIRRKFK